ncbi:transglycosylase SLT domain-containing protein [Actinomadura barringtoniae]
MSAPANATPDSSLSRVGATGNNTAHPFSAVENAAIITSVFGAGDGPEAVRIARCESNLNAGAYNPSTGQAGLFQLTREWFNSAGGGNILDPWDNTRAAGRIFLRLGWHAWAECA